MSPYHPVHNDDNHQGWTGKLFFSRGRAGGKEKSMGRGTPQLESPSLSSASSPASSPSSSLALRMIFGTWRSYFISWQIFENKLWCPVSKKIRRYFHFLLSLAYPIDRLDWALFSVVILFHHWFPLLEKVDIGAFILPRNFPVVLIIFTGRGTSPSPQCGAGRGVHPCLLLCTRSSMLHFVCLSVLTELI